MATNFPNKAARQDEILRTLILSGSQDMFQELAGLIDALTLQVQELDNRVQALEQAAA